MSNILDSKYSDYLTALDTVGITNTTDILATGVKMYNDFNKRRREYSKYKTYL